MAVSPSHVSLFLWSTCTPPTFILNSTEMKWHLRKKYMVNDVLLWRWELCITSIGAIITKRWPERLFYFQAWPVRRYYSAKQFSNSLGPEEARGTILTKGKTDYTVAASKMHWCQCQYACRKSVNKEWKSSLKKTVFCCQEASGKSPNLKTKVPSSEHWTGLLLYSCIVVNVETSCCYSKDSDQSRRFSICINGNRGLVFISWLGVHHIL